MSDVFINISSTPTPIGAMILRDGATTTYGAGDDYDSELERRIASPLPGNNPFGNTNRFTDELGSTSYTNGIVIDWTSYNSIVGKVLGIQRTAIATSLNWDNARIAANSTSIGSFTSGWRLPVMLEIASFINVQASRCFNYPPFNDANNNRFWTGSTYGALTTYAWYLGNQPAIGLVAVPKTTTSSTAYRAVRLFTVTGTTLT